MPESQPMIVLFTDFGITGPYLGQIQAVLHKIAPTTRVIDLLANAPSFDVQAASYLLASFTSEFPRNSIFLCVVDPGVGGPRKPMILYADGQVFVGPGNGLFEIVARRSIVTEAQVITWQPKKLSATFHGRDLFAPVAAALAVDANIKTKIMLETEWRRQEWPDDLNQIIYLDNFGNAISGLRASTLGGNSVVQVNGTVLKNAQTFSAVPKGHAFWYENANGLLEIAINRGSAAKELNLKIGSLVEL